MMHESLFLYLLIEGEVKLKFHEANKSPVKMKKGENDYFGERELLQNSKRNSSAVANTDCLLYSINKNDVFKLPKDILFSLYNENDIEPPAKLLDASPIEITENPPAAELHPDEYFSIEHPGNEFWIAETELSKNKDNDLPDFRENTQIENLDLTDEIIAEEQGTKEEIIIDEDLSARKILINEPQEEIQLNMDEPSAQSDYKIIGTEISNSKEDIEENNLITAPDIKVDNEIGKETAQTDIEKFSEQIDTTIQARMEEKALITDEFPEGNKAKDLSKDKVSNFIRIAKYIASDFNIPLTLIKNYAEVIRKKNYSKETNEISEMISNYSSLMNSYFRALSLISGKGELNKEVRDFNGVINYTLTLLAEYVKSRNVTLYKKLDEDVKVNIDPEVFYYAAFQIIKNACDAIDEFRKDLC